MAEATIRWFAAIGWGSEKHQACVMDAHGRVAGEHEFPHSGAGLAELADWIQRGAWIGCAAATIPSPF
jgi:hypothetical protein